MLQTIRVEIDASGHIHPLEPLEFTPVGRALLTLLDPVGGEVPASQTEKGSAARALEFLARPGFSVRPVADQKATERRIAEFRDDWGGK